MPSAEKRECEESNKEVQHSPVGDGHLSYFGIIIDPVVVEDVEAVCNLPAKVHSRGFFWSRQNVVGHDGAVPSTPKAEDCREDGAANLERQIEWAERK